MENACAAPERLVEAALAASPRLPDALRRHLRECERCRLEIKGVRELAATLTRTAASSDPPSAACLDDTALAAAIDGVAGEERMEEIAHLASCSHCRARLADVIRLLHDVDRAALEGALERPARFRIAGTLTATLVAATLAGVMLLRPARPPEGMTGTPTADSQHRESAITMTVAPRILAPGSSAARGDSLAWTSVPYADRYRVTVFDDEGTLVLDRETPDTTLPMQPELTRSPGAVFLWKVEARTGWDRWVASEWREFTVRTNDDGQ